MMGWAAATGTLDPGAWLLGSVLYAWQFPHFNSLSWNLRKDYARAGYMMMSVIDPKLNARVALRYSLLLFPISALAPYLEITTWYFFPISSVINGYMAVKAFKFWKESNDSSARPLFFSSLVHLPLYLCLMMICKSRYNDQSQKIE
jgi:protoheme IX farnesyltransferase